MYPYNTSRQYKHMKTIICQQNNIAFLRSREINTVSENQSINYYKWILHQIFIYSDSVLLADDLNNGTPNLPTLPNPLLSFWIHKLTNK